MRGRYRNVTLTVLVSAVLAAVALPVGTAGASGGGGCGRPVTDARGTTVRIRSYCFGPTILRARPGTQVTFVNRDSAPHTVLGANGTWGSYRELRRGDDLTYRFQRAGVYPFVCTYHVGMVGAVVVGGAGPAMAASTGGAGSVLRVSTETTEEAVTDVRSVPVATSTLADPGALSTPWSAIGLAVVASLAAACVMLRHGRREREGA